MERTQFTFYESFFKAISRIKKKADRADAYDAICAYALYGTEPDLDKMPDSAAIAFELSKPNMDASRRKATSGKRGGEAKQTVSKTEANAKQTVSKTEANAKQTASKIEIEKENKKEIEIEKENECYNPLSPSSVACSDFMNRINATPSPMCLAQLSNYAEQMGADVCKRAFDIALDEKKTSWSYIRTILENKKTQGVKCIADWDELDKKHEQEKKTQPRGNKNPNRMVEMDFQPSADRIRKNAESLDKLLAETRGDFDGR